MTEYDYTSELAEQPTELPQEKIVGLNSWDEFQLVIPLESYKKIISYAIAADNIEITGFADVEFNKEKNEFVVGEVYLLEQNAGGADVHIEEEDIQKFNFEMVKAGKEQMPRVWWHSHVDMQAFFSGTDEGTLKELQNDTYIIALVVNKRAEMKAKMYVRQKTIVKSKVVTENALFGKQTETQDDDNVEYIEIDPLPITVQYFDKTQIPATIKNEVKKKLKNRVVTFKLPYKTPFKGIFGTKKNQFQKDGTAHFMDFENVEEHLSRKEKRRRQRQQWEQNSQGASDIHDEYSPDPKVKVFKLPRDTEAAQEKIMEKQLKQVFCRYAKTWIWQAEESQDIWVDFWQAVPWGFGEWKTLVN